jgi:hypothetical protein
MGSKYTHFRKSRELFCSVMQGLMALLGNVEFKIEHQTEFGISVCILDSCRNDQAYKLRRF